KPHASSFFREAQFSNDGTTIITNNGNQTLTTFVLPSDLLDETKQPHTLSAINTIHSPSPIQSYAVYPKFSLEDLSTTVALSASKDLPITLSNVLHPDVVHATYPLINATTEAYITPNSLLWTADGTRFIAGSDNRISVFDASADGSGPVIQHRTAPGRAEKRFPGRSSAQHCRGIVSALDLSIDHYLAAGTTQREIAIYEHEGMGGQAVTSFSLAPLPGEVDVAKGNGVTQMKWTSDGTYLLIAERQSDCIQVWDLRHSLRRVGWLGGRGAKTTQRLGVDILSTADGVEVWAGGMDGRIRMWRNPGLVEGE
ncbi:WD40-repeat-containing domain protein, partial [Neohortaea acidophila]